MTQVPPMLVVGEICHIFDRALSLPSVEYIFPKGNWNREWERENSKGPPLSFTATVLFFMYLIEISGV